MIYQGHSVTLIDSHVRVRLSNTAQSQEARPQPAIAVHSSILDNRAGFVVNENAGINGLTHRSAGVALLEPPTVADEVYTLYHVVGSFMSAAVNIQPFIFFGNTGTVHAAVSGVVLGRHWPLIGTQNGRGGCSIDQVVAMPPQIEGGRLIVGVSFYNATGGPITALMTGLLSVERLSDPPVDVIDARIS